MKYNHPNIIPQNIRAFQEIPSVILQPSPGSSQSDLTTFGVASCNETCHLQIGTKSFCAQAEWEPQIYGSEWQRSIHFDGKPPLPAGTFESLIFPFPVWWVPCDRSLEGSHMLEPFPKSLPPKKKHLRVM